MAEYVLTEKAKDDLRRIWHYTVDTWSIEQAKYYYNEILDTCEAIASGRMHAGSYFEGLRPGVHGFRMKHHVVFYRVLSKGKIRVIRILHDRMDFPRHF